MRILDRKGPNTKPLDTAESAQIEDMKKQNSDLLEKILGGSRLTRISEEVSNKEDEVITKESEEKQRRYQRIYGMNARMYRSNHKHQSDVSHAASSSTKSQSVPTSDLESDS